MAAGKKKSRIKVVQKESNNHSDKTQFDPLHQVAFWGLALLLFFPPYFRGLFFAPEQEKALMFAALVFWLTFLWRWLQNDHKFLRGPLDWFALALPVVYIISSFTAVNKGLAIDEVVKNILYFLTYWSASRLIRNEEDVHKLLHVIYASAIGVALAGLATATEIIHIKDGFLGGRIYSSFQYPNALAGYMGAVVFIGAYLWNRARDKQKEAFKANRNDIWLKLERLNIPGYLYACGNFLLLAVLFGTKSRGGLLVFGLVFLIYLVGVGAEKRLTSTLHLGFLGAVACISINNFIPLAVAKHMGQAWLWVLGGLLLVLAGQVIFYYLDRLVLVRWSGNGRAFNLAFIALALCVIVFSGLLVTFHPIVDKITDSGYLETGFHRIYYMGAAVDIFKERPLLGWGGGGWQEAYQSFLSYRYITRQVHSYYFQVGVETGILGLLAVTGIGFSFLYLACRLYNGSLNGRRQLVWVLATSFIMIAGHAMIDFDLSLSALTLVLWSFIGMAAGIAREGVQEETKTSRRKYEAPKYIPLAVTTVVLVFLLLGCSFLLQSQSLMVRGINLLKSNQVERGLEHMEKAVTYNPFSAGYRVTLSQVYKSLGRDKEALAEARRAVTLSRYDIAPRNNLARIALATGNFGESAEAAAATVELAPNELRVYENLAQILVLLGIEELKANQDKNTRAYFEQALAVPQKVTRRWEDLSETDKKMWQGQQLVISHKLKLYAGEASYWLGDFPTAEKNFKEASGNEKFKSEALLYLALIGDKHGRQQEAADFLEQAKRLSPGIEAEYEKLRKLPVILS